MSARPWTDDDHKTLEALAGARVGASEIAKRLGRTLSSVSSHAWRCDVPISGPTSQEKRAAWLEEMTWARLVSCHGEKRATAIISGNDPKTQADLAAWRKLGRRSAA